MLGSPCLGNCQPFHLQRPPSVPQLNLDQVQLEPQLPAATMCRFSNIGCTSVGVPIIGITVFWGLLLSRATPMCKLV